GRRGLAVLPESRARIKCDLFERAVSLVMKQEILGLVVRNVDIGIAVAVVIGGRHAHRATLVGRDAGLFAHVRECAFAAVMKQQIGGALVIQRTGIIVGGVVGAVGGVELNVPADEQVHAAVAIVVEPRRVDRPAVYFQAGLRGDILKRA